MGADATGPDVSLDDVLMTLFVELLYFLETAPADKLDPQYRERMTREAAFQLGRLSPDQLEPLVAFIRAQGEASAWPAEREFLRALPAHLGWS